jgi:hypothetical protein
VVEAMNDAQQSENKQNEIPTIRLNYSGGAAHQAKRGCASQATLLVRCARVILLRIGLNIENMAHITTCDKWYVCRLGSHGMIQSTEAC